MLSLTLTSVSVVPTSRMQFLFLAQTRALGTAWLFGSTSKPPQLLAIFSDRPGAKRATQRCGVPASPQLTKNQDSEIAGDLRQRADSRHSGISWG